MSSVFFMLMMILLIFGGSQCTKINEHKEQRLEQERLDFEYDLKHQLIDQDSVYIEKPIDGWYEEICQY